MCSKIHAALAMYRSELVVSWQLQRALCCSYLIAGQLLWKYCMWASASAPSLPPVNDQERRTHMVLMTLEKVAQMLTPRKTQYRDVTSSILQHYELYWSQSWSGPRSGPCCQQLRALWKLLCCDQHAVQSYDLCRCILQFKRCNLGIAILPNQTCWGK